MVYEIKIFIKLSVKVPFPISDSDQNKLTQVYEYRFHSNRITNEIFNIILKDKMKMITGLDINMYTYLTYPIININERYIDINSHNTLYCDFSKRIQNDGSLPLVLIVDNQYISILLNHMNITSLEEPEICPVCLSSSNRFLQPYTCSHNICESCHRECISHNLITCSLCRSESTSSNILSRRYTIVPHSDNAYIIEGPNDSFMTSAVRLTGLYN